MKDSIVGIVYGLIVVAAIAFTVWWWQYKYHDCLHVGHTKLYCLMDFTS